jgi:FKBP-type peptidyl-prolyl cis-trans isomerase FkpA
MIRRSLTALAAVSLFAAGCVGSKSEQVTESSQGASATTNSAPGGSSEGHAVTTPSGLVYEDLKVGDGKLAETGMRAYVHYTGWLTDGTEFDSSKNSGEPLNFQIGGPPPTVIAGWHEGIRGMRIGGKRKLTIPPALAYGATGTPGGPIPPNATIIFDVELVDLR